MAIVLQRPSELNGRRTTYSSRNTATTALRRDPTGTYGGVWIQLIGDSAHAAVLLKYRCSSKRSEGSWNPDSGQVRSDNNWVSAEATGPGSTRRTSKLHEPGRPGSAGNIGCDLFRGCPSANDPGRFGMALRSLCQGNLMGGVSAFISFCHQWTSKK